MKAQSWQIVQKSWAYSAGILPCSYIRHGIGRSCIVVGWHTSSLIEPLQQILQCGSPVPDVPCVLYSAKFSSQCSLLCANGASIRIKTEQFNHQCNSRVGYVRIQYPEREPLGMTKVFALNGNLLQLEYFDCAVQEVGNEQTFALSVVPNISGGFEPGYCNLEFAAQLSPKNAGRLPT